MKESSIASSGSRSNHLITAISTVFTVLLTGQAAYATQGALDIFNAKYPASSSGTNARCQLCHGSSSNSTWNEYGWALRNNSVNFDALESVTSVNINGGTTMLDEINASTQPGWTTGNDNKLYSKNGNVSLIAAPAGLSGLDPAVANQPPEANPGGPYNGTANELVMFDGSGSSDPDGSITSYDWDFGDGNADTGVSPTHAYADVGTYDVTLTVTDDDGASNTAATTADIVAGPQDPVADPGGPYKEIVNTALTLDGSGSNDPDGGELTAYDWDFGDGATGTSVAPTHTYTATGTYTVTLTVMDDEGDSSQAATTTVEIVLPQDPVADPGGPYTAVEGRALTLDGSGSFDPDGGDIAEYNWDFGDDTTGTGSEPVHTYATAGTYTVTLVVMDEEGAESAPVTTEVEVTTASSDNGGCTIGVRGATDPTLPLLVLVALLYLTRRRVYQGRICDQD